MNDDFKKTILNPRFANRLPYRTLVMNRPPEMIALDSKRPQPGVENRAGASPRQGVLPGAPRTKLPVPSHVRNSRFPSAASPTENSSISTRPTRMAVVQAVLSSSNENPFAAQRLLQPPPMALPYSASDSLTVRKGRVRTVVFCSCAAILLGVSLVLAFSEGSTAVKANTQSVSELQAEIVNVEKAYSAMDLSPSAQHSVEPMTEEAAGVMLLAGRQREALSLYQGLAKSPSATPGIQAMVEVLKQKVAAQ